MWERRLVLLTLGATFCLLLVGGIVHATGSSLACPDWPLCYGQVFPEMVGGVFYEHSHRLLASGIGLLTAVLATIWARRRDDRGLRRWGLFGLLLVVFQGILGGLTVIYRLPVMVSATHLGTAMLFFAWLVFMVFRCEKNPGLGVGAVVGDGFGLPPRGPVRLALVLVFAQLVLGALVRHTGSGLACGFDGVLCAGSLMPQGGPAWLHMSHRLLALLVLAVVVWATLKPLAWARRSQVGLVRLLGISLHALVLVQVGLGVWTVVSGINVVIVTAHLGVGALLWGTLVAFYLALGPLRGRLSYVG